MRWSLSRRAQMAPVALLMAGTLVTLPCLDTFAGNAGEGAPAPTAVRQSMELAYIHGVDAFVAVHTVGPDALPALHELLRERGFSRRDNVVSFLAFVGNRESTVLLSEFLARPEPPLDSPEEERALLLVPQAFGHLARSGERLALARLLEMTDSSRGAWLESARRSGNPRALRRDLLRMSLRGLALSGSLEAHQRLVEIAAGRPVAGLDLTVSSREASKNLDVWEDVQRAHSPAAASVVERSREGAVGGASHAVGSDIPLTCTTTQTEVRKSLLDYANHASFAANPPPDGPMTDERASIILKQATDRIARSDFDDCNACDIACCVALDRRPVPGGTFGQPADQLDIINDDNEARAVITDPAARVKVVRLINYCAHETGVNFLGCGEFGGWGFTVVRSSDPRLEALVWAHEYGHNVGLDHTQPADKRYIMNATAALTKASGLKEGDCAAYWSPPAVARADVTPAGACADADTDLVLDFDDNCPTANNLRQGDGDGDGTGDACDANCSAPAFNPTLLVETTINQGIQLSWTSAGEGMRYDVIKGDLRSMKDGCGDYYRALEVVEPDSDVCLASQTPSTKARDLTGLPPAFEVQFYLVRAVDPCGAKSSYVGAQVGKGYRDTEVELAPGTCP